MSRPSSFIDNLLQEIPTTDELKVERNINLVDHTSPADRSSCPGSAISAEANSDGGVGVVGASPLSVDSPLLRRIANNSMTLSGSIRQQRAKHKYGRYSRDRYEDSWGGIDDASSALRSSHEDAASTPRPSDVASPTPTSHFERGKAKAKGILKRKRALGRGEEKENRVIDVLYENQRGSFLFGIPRYSAATLLPCDPKPWQNADFRTSPVDIRNAQVPDPSWEWEWKNWYVDMSRDVDEEGWEYSFFFRVGFNWHGNHPWLHSFVRRRRWLRMRKKKKEEHVTKEKSHELTAEYFTIHSNTLKSATEDTGNARSSEMVRWHARGDGADTMDITDIGALIAALRRCAVDREKFIAVRKFLDEGGDNLFYLPQRMPEIMGLFLYQASRRQLLAELIAQHDVTHERRESLADHNHAGADEAKRREHDIAVRHSEYLHNAVMAAEQQVQRLEFWSDIKGMANEGEMLHGGRWQIGSGGHPQDAFASKQSVEEGMHELHRPPEHLEGGENAPNNASSTQRNISFDAQTSLGVKGDFNPERLRRSLYSRREGSRIGRGVTTKESNSSDKGNRVADSSTHKEKQKAVDLPDSDGKEEGDKDSNERGDGETGAVHQEPVDMVPENETEGVNIVEPKADNG